MTLLILLFVSLMASLVSLIGSTTLRRPNGFAAASVIVFLTANWCLKRIEHRYQLGNLPDAFGVQDVLYSKKEASGLFDSDKISIVIYALPENIAERIETDDMWFLGNLAPNTRSDVHDWRGEFDDWRPTPIVSDRHWHPAPGYRRSSVYDYACTSDFCIDIDAKALIEAERIFNTPGSYYAFNRNSMIVVSPARRRVVFVYSWYEPRGG